MANHQKHTKMKRKLLFSGQFGKIVPCDIFSKHQFTISIYNNGDVELQDSKPRRMVNERYKKGTNLLATAKRIGKKYNTHIKCANVLHHPYYSSLAKERGKS